MPRVQCTYRRHCVNAGTSVWSHKRAPPAKGDQPQNWLVDSGHQPENWTGATLLFTLDAALDFLRCSSDWNTLKLGSSASTLGATRGLLVVHMARPWSRGQFVVVAEQQVAPDIPSLVR